MKISNNLPVKYQNKNVFNIPPVYARFKYSFDNMDSYFEYINDLITERVIQSYTSSKRYVIGQVIDIQV